MGSFWGLNIGILPILPRVWFLLNIGPQRRTDREDKADFLSHGRKRSGGGKLAVVRGSVSCVMSQSRIIAVNN